MRVRIAMALIAATSMAGAGRARSALDTPQQVSAEREMVALLADPQVQAIQRTVEAELAAGPRGRDPQAAKGLHEAIVQWTGSLILRERAGDPARPAILWQSDDAPHSWHGISVPGRALSGDNPDNIYRSSFFDGAGRYEIVGQYDPARRPAQITFEFNRGTPGDLAMKPARKGSTDIGNQIAMLTERDLHIAPDGSFRITVGPDGDVHTPAEPIAFMIRESLADWTTPLGRIEIRRLDKTGAAPWDRAALRAHVLADLPGYLRFWGKFPELWYAGIPANTLIGPKPRDGGWGYLAFLVTRLAPDEALVLRTTRGGASYTGIQFSDQWTITPDERTYLTSINTAQATPDADGAITYVVAGSDPGVANWIDTRGLIDGSVALRWQGFPTPPVAADLVKAAKVVKLADIAALPGVARVTPAQRTAQLAKRAADYRARIGQ